MVSTGRQRLKLRLLPPKSLGLSWIAKEHGQKQARRGLLSASSGSGPVARRCAAVMEARARCRLLHMPFGAIVLCRSSPSHPLP